MDIHFTAILFYNGNSYVDKMVCLYWKAHRSESVNSLWPSDATWRHRTGSTLAKVMAWCPTAPSNYTGCQISWGTVDSIFFNGFPLDVYLGIHIYPCKLGDSTLLTDRNPPKFLMDSLLVFSIGVPLDSSEKSLFDSPITWTNTDLPGLPTSTELPYFVRILHAKYGSTNLAFKIRKLSSKAYLFWVANQSRFVVFYALKPSNTSLITKTLILLSSTCSSNMCSSSLPVPVVPKESTRVSTGSQWVPPE